MSRTARNTSETGELGLDLRVLPHADRTPATGRHDALGRLLHRVDSPLGATSASRCQTSSVRNGIIGCKSRSSVSSTWAKSRWATARLDCPATAL